MNEWRTIPSWPNYSASDDGVIRNDVRNRELKIKRRPDGYLLVYLSGQIGNSGWKYVHRLVCEAFNGPADGRILVRHLNGEPGDNRPENLAWGSYTDNVNDAMRHGTVPKGAQHYAARLSEDDVLTIREIFRQRSGKRFPNGFIESLADQFGVVKSTIYHVVYANSWKHLNNSSATPSATRGAE